MFELHMDLSISFRYVYKGLSLTFAIVVW